MCAVRIWLATAMIAPAAVAQPARGELTAAQLVRLERGERIVIARERAGFPWPAVTVFAYVSATPEHAAAVFTDYASHAAYIPDLKRSRVARVIDSATAEVDYLLAMPIVRDEEYTVRNRISRDSVGAVRVDWTLVHATSTKATTGHARFIPHTNSRTGVQGTLIEYHNFVTPGSRIAGLGFIRSRAIVQVDETVRALVQRIQTTRPR